MGTDVLVLVSTGRHPVSGRTRMSSSDASALELALRLTASPAAIHVGSAQEAALRDYLGMGLARLTVLEGARDSDDILPALCDQIRSLNPRLVILGERAEAGEASGMLPYLLAEALDRTLLPQTVNLAFEGERTIATRQLGGGRRHRIAAEGPVIATVPAQGVETRFPAFGPARRGMIEATQFEAAVDDERESWTLAPARLRPPKLRPGGSSQQAAARAPLTGLSPETAAEQIYAFLATHGVLRE